MILLLQGSGLHAQCTGDTLNVVNPSFEGPTDPHVTPSPWNNCMSGQTPDTQPGNWGVTMSPTDGTSYLGLVNELCDTWSEGASQQLSGPMTAGTEYTFTIDLASPGNTGVGGVTGGCIELQVYGGFSNCDTNELLWTSPVFNGYTTWGTYTVTFTPSANYTHLILVSNTPDDPCMDCSDQPYLNVDNMTPVMSEPSIGVLTPALGDTIDCDETFTGNNKCPLDSLILTGDFSGSPVSATLLTDSTWEASVSYPSDYSGTDTVEGQGFFKNGDTGFVDHAVYIKNIDATASLTDPSCNGSCDGEIVLNASGGATPYQYSIDSGSSFQGSSTFSAQCAGNYDILIAGDSGCVHDTALSLNQAPPLVIDDTTLTNATCNGDCDGSIEFQVSGGTTPYQYSIDNGSSFQSSNTFNGLCAGTYDLVVEDSNGCQAMGQVRVEEPAPLSFDTTGIDPACAGESSGSIRFHGVGGGTKPYSFSIDGGSTFQSDSSFNGLTAGNYNLVLEDANGCQVNGQLDLTDPPPLQIDGLTLNDASCAGLCDGEADVSVSGGSGSYTYNWSGAGAPAGSSDADSLCAANHTLTVVDDSGCTVDTSFTIGEPAPLTIDSTSSVNANCSKPDGSATVEQVSGGTSPYGYQWEDGQSSATATNLTPGDHGVKVTDDQGCTVTDTVTVGNNVAQTIVLDSIQQASCFGACDGGAYISVSGGTAPFSYSWNDPNGQTSQDATGLCAGTYVVSVTDANGCEEKDTVTITEPSPLQASASSDTTICVGGVAVMSAKGSGGTPPYTFHWDQGLGAGKVQPVSPGSNTVYNVYVEDANGCTSASKTVRVKYHPELSVTALSDDSVCPGTSKQLSAIGNGGIGSGYSYSWSNGANGKSTIVTPGSTSDHVVTLEDGCETPAVKDTVTVTLHDLPNVQIDGVDLNGCSPFNASLVNATDPSMVGGDCTWDLGDGSKEVGCDTIRHIYDQPGCYDVSLTVTSPEGCMDSTTRTNYVCVRPYPKADFKYLPKNSDVQDPEVSFTNLSTGASSYRWTFPGLDTLKEEHPVHEFPSDGAGTYDACLKATNSYGCSDSICKEVSIDGKFILYVPNAFTPDGDGVNDKFGPVVQGHDPENFKFRIYDRWGEVVFESDHPEKKWDGSVKGDADEDKTDVYVWQVVTKNKFTGKEVVKRGHVTLIH